MVEPTRKEKKLAGKMDSGQSIALSNTIYLKAKFFKEDSAFRSTLPYMLFLC